VVHDTFSAIVRGMLFSHENWFVIPRTSQWLQECTKVEGSYFVIYFLFDTNIHTKGWSIFSHFKHFQFVMSLWFCHWFITR
jgi:hypothetical protein